MQPTNSNDYQADVRDVTMQSRRRLMKGMVLAGMAGAGGLLAEGVAPDLSGTAGAQLRGSRVEQWSLQEITLRSGKQYENPFQEVQLQATFSCGPAQITAEGFYDGDAIWRVRLMPERQGHWTFRTKSNDASLNGMTGEFEVTAPSGNNHGPVRVAKTFHFTYTDGTAFYPLGTTTYGLFLGGLDDQVRMMGTLSRFAFNKARLMVMAFSSLAPGDNAFFRGRDSQLDFNRYNVDFYRRIEAGLLDLQAIGVEADLILLHPYDSRGQLSRLPQEQDERYIRYTAARLSAFRNVWWTLTNEFDLYPLFGIKKDWPRLGELLASSDPYAHLRGIHNSCCGFYDNSESWITHVILQDITLQRLTAGPRNDSTMGLDARKVGKPVVIDEYGYEGNIAMTWGSIAPREAVEMHWSIVMAGAYGSHGESYFGTPGGTYVGEAPDRLAFLKKTMMETPFQDLEPLPDVMNDQSAAITVLGVPGTCYIFHFAQPKEKASWNLGFFGPATPSHPLPVVVGSTDPNTWNGPIPKFTIKDGSYRVEMIDIWQMKTRFLGFTAGASQQFRSPIEPGIIRLTRIENLPPGEKALPMSELTGRHSLSL